MLAEQRQAHILDQLRLYGVVRVAELCEQLDVSDMTVRRDLAVLEEQGLLQKVHGGAIGVSESASYEPSFIAKSALQQTEKEAIATAAAALVQEGTAIGMSAGTTTHALAHELLNVPGLTIVTNSLRIAETLYQGGRSDQTVILTGGERTPSEALVGPMAIDALQRIHLDIVFMGVHGMTAKAGFTTPNLLEAETNRALIATGNRLVVVSDHTKWGVVGISSIAGLSDADVLITDEGLSIEALTVLESEIEELVVTKPGTSARSAR